MKMKEFAKVKIRTDGCQAQVVINGIDFAYLADEYTITITQKAADVPRITLSIPITDSIEFEGECVIPPDLESGD